VIAAGNYVDGSLKALQTAVNIFNRKSENYTVTVEYYDPKGSGMFPSTSKLPTTWQTASRLT